MKKEFEQLTWDDQLARDWQALLGLAIGEDLGAVGDWTSRAVVPEEANCRAAIVARQRGVVAGLPGVAATLARFDSRLNWVPESEDGCAIEKGTSVGTIEGPARGLLAAERILLNLVGRLSGIATLTRQYVEAISGTSAHIYDTRKTTPGWRRLEKYAVRCGGGRNHRGGLDKAVLIKDNHLALGAQAGDGTGKASGTRVASGTRAEGATGSASAHGHRFTPAEAVARARHFVATHGGNAAMIIEVEVDTLKQLDAVLPAQPDIVLLDNMTPGQLREAVARRNAFDQSIELEASGGVNIATVGEIARSGVERISVGALTHSAASLDFGLDFIS